MKFLSALFSLFIALTLSQLALAYDMADLNKLLDTNLCRRCDLSGANLRGANLYCADLTGANLVGADLTGANFASAILACSNRDGVVNEDTIWPDEIAPENAVEDARWALREAWKHVEQKQKETEEEPEDRAA